MNLFRLAFAYLRDRVATTFLNLLLLVFGVTTITMVLLVAHQLRERVNREVAGIDLVVGAKGSPLQLILATVFQIDAPTGNIPLEEAEFIRRHPLVASAIPLAMGDSVSGFRIVGTEPALFSERGARMARGRLWQRPMEAVLGAQVARVTGLELGASFIGAHGLQGGLAHAEHPYTVVGVLEPTGTVLDRLVFTAIESVWLVHEHPRPSRAPSVHHHEEHEDAGHEEHAEHEDHANDAHQHGAHAERGPSPDAEITALLVRYRSPLAAVQLPRLVNERPHLMAASPAFEAARLLAILGFGLDTLRLFGLLVMAVAALSVFVALTNALEERRGDIAVMRVLGATRGLVLRELFLEALVLSAAGLVLGLALAHLLVELLARSFRQAFEAGLSGWVLAPEELWLVPAVLAVGVLAALLPAVRAYRLDLASTLARG